MTEFEMKYASEGAITGLSTGLKDLDYYTDGLHPGEMTVIAAYPSFGKTSLAMNIAENVALNLNKAVGVFSMEMTSVSLVKRCICSIAKVNSRAVSAGNILESDFPKLVGAAGKLSGSPIYLNDESDLSISKLRAKARRMRQKYQVSLIIIDYLQLMNANGGARKMENRQQEIADISNGIKGMAKELGVPVLVLSQLTETQNGPRLRGSADIGQDADGVWLLQPPKKKVGEVVETEDFSPIDLWIQKQRNGPRNVVVKLLFQKKFTRFEAAVKSPVQDESQYTAPEETQGQFPD
jgi:replicative DNA helicase